jgi:membrane protease subunit (stomatin/prohibitin family)
MPKVIEWEGASSEDILKCYRIDIKLIDQLVVRENQKAIFMKSGKVYDILGAGRYTLTSANIPLLYGVAKKFFGGKTPFQTEVIFINLKKFMIKFGTSTKTNTKDMVPVGVHGIAYLKINDPAIFAFEIVGNNEKSSTDDVEDFIRAFIIENFINNLAEYTSFEVYKQTKETSLHIKDDLSPEIKKYGLELDNIKIEGIDIDEEYRKKLFYQQRGASGEQLMGKEIAEKYAEAIKESKGNAAFATGMVVSPPMMEASSELLKRRESKNMVTCPKCKSLVDFKNKFCPECGTKINGSFCSNCGAKLKSKIKFCPECGGRL